MQIANMFEREIRISYDEFLEQHGFFFTKSHVNETAFDVTYRNEERYILIGGLLDPKDYPFYLYLTFGEGSDELPESDWNAVAFWRIMEQVSPDDYKKFLHMFEIPVGIKKEQVADQVEITRDLCKECGKEFLAGDLEIFRFVRAKQNKDREPRKIFVLNPDGEHKQMYDPQSVALKKKFS
jgi:hypothetical protein